MSTREHAEIAAGALREAVKLTVEEADALAQTARSRANFRASAAPIIAHEETGTEQAFNDLAADSVAATLEAFAAFRRTIEDHRGPGAAW